MAASSIPSTMKACQIVECGTSLLARRNLPLTEDSQSINPTRSIPFPTPYPSSLQPNDLLVKIATASFCHTDTMVASGVFASRLPQTASHEGAGVVVAMGSAVKHFRLGDRIMCGLTTHRCRKCSHCQGPEDFLHYCPYQDRAPGISRDGAFAEYLVVDATESNRLPDKVLFETAAPLACAGRTAFRGVTQANLDSGQWWDIVGSGGGLGRLGVQFARALGLKVIGVDARDEGLALTRELGADLVLDARRDKKDIMKEVMKVTGGEGCHATVNLSDARSAAALACAITMMHGRMIQIAQPEEVSVPFTERIFRDVRIEGSLMCSVLQGQHMLDMVAQHNITVKTNVFHGLDGIGELVELAHSGRMQGKGVVIVDEEAIKIQKQGRAKLA